MINRAVDARATGHQEFSSRALVKIVPIMLLLLGPLFLILVCVGYRVFVKTKKAQANNRSRGLSSRRHSRQSRDDVLGVEELQQQDDERMTDTAEENRQRETEIN
ncbi:hypothetical protein ACI65C_001064 [Semiaphis heraclei]